MAPTNPESREPAKDAPSLPAWKAFVLQLSQETTADGATFAGRVEHMASGRRERFRSGEELLSAVMRLLHAIDDRATDP